MTQQKVFFPKVCLCGSTRFEKEWMETAERLTLEGKIVLMVNVWSKKDKLHEPSTEEEIHVKTNLDTLHKEKIRLADYVLVINKDDYIGKSTRSEIEFAKKIGRPVEFLYPHKEPQP
jgi:ATP-dependent helicase YprA (DUF1998 family)